MSPTREPLGVIHIDPPLLPTSNPTTMDSPDVADTIASLVEAAQQKTAASLAALLNVGLLPPKERLKAAIRAASAVSTTHPRASLTSLKFIDPLFIQRAGLDHVPRGAPYQLLVATTESANPSRQPWTKIVAAIGKLRHKKRIDEQDLGNFASWKKLEGVVLHRWTVSICADVFTYRAVGCGRS